MKKILLLLSTLGLFASSIYGQSTFDYYEFEEAGSSFTLSEINYNSPPSWFDAAKIRGAAFDPYDTNFTVGYLVYEIMANEAMDVSANPIPAGKYVLNLDVQSAPVLTSVITAGAYQGAPRIISVRARQSNVTDSRDVLFDYGILLGQGKGEAYVEYWFKANPEAAKWENIDNANIQGTPEGIVTESASGYKSVIWNAGNSSFGNNINTANARIRVTAKLGNTESGWDGESEFGHAGESNSSAGTAIFEIFDVNDMVGVPYWDEFAPEGYASSVDKRDTILANAGLVSVGTYDDGVTVQPVYDFTGKESFRDQFAGGLTGHFLFCINDTNIVRVKPQSGSGN